MAKGKFPFEMFEKSGKDVEVKGKGKEGSKQEEAFDKKQAKRFAEGGGVEDGENANIGDDTRARALKWAREQAEAPETPSPAPRKAAKTAPSKPDYSNEGRSGRGAPSAVERIPAGKDTAPTGGEDKAWLSEDTKRNLANAAMALPVGAGVVAGAAKLGRMGAAAKAAEATDKASVARVAARRASATSQRQAGNREVMDRMNKRADMWSDGGFSKGGSVRGAGIAQRGHGKGTMR